MSSKQKVKRWLPKAFCVRLDKPYPDGSRYIVWPGPVQGRGFEQPACGIGRTAAAAWASVKRA